MRQIPFSILILLLLLIGPPATAQQPAPDTKQAAPPDATTVPAPTAQDYSAVRDSLGRRLDTVTTEIVLANRAAEKDLNLLARLEVQPNEIIEFYEPKPGQILISGAGAPDSPSKMDRAPRSPVELWRQAAPGFDMPPALRDAVERWRKAEPTQEKEQPAIKQEWGGGSPQKSEGQSSEPAKPTRPQSPLQSFRSGGWCDTGFFHDRWGQCPAPAYDFKVCLNNWWGGAYAYHHDAYDAWTSVCPATGWVVLRLSSNEYGGGVWTVAQDTVRWWHGIDGACASVFNDCPYVRADVEQAQGKRFHFRFGAIDE